VKGYDKYILVFSGGKDSTACLLHLLELGIPKEKIELWHHLVDGSPEEMTLMDWACTEDYCRKFAEAFEIPIYFSWKEGGFMGEASRCEERTAPITFEIPGGKRETVGGRGGKLSTRRMFPQVSGDLTQRWCSAYLKIDVYSAAIANQKRFHNSRILIVSGERGEESAQRACYDPFHKDRTDNRFQGERTIRYKVKGKYRSRTVTKGKKDRHVDRWRPIKDWKEGEVWEIIKRWNVVVHPCYYMGWSRCSCQFCIFGGANQMASAFKVSPLIGFQLMAMEEGWGVTIKRNESLEELIVRGEAYEGVEGEMLALARSKVYYGDIFTGTWTMPIGAFGDSCGPT